MLLLFFLHRFQRACTLYGLSDVDLFQTTDLWDFKNIALVTQTIFAIGRAVCIHLFMGVSFEFFVHFFILLFKIPNRLIFLQIQTYKHPEYRGPPLGPRPAEENRRDFTEDQLRASEAIIGLQAGTNRGANQSGQSFGASRKIILGK